MIISSRNNKDNDEILVTTAAEEEDQQPNTLKLYQQIKSFPNTILQMKYNLNNNNRKDDNSYYYRIIFDEIDMDHNEIINDNDIYNYLIKYNCKNITLQDVSLVMNYYTDSNCLKINDFILMMNDSRLTMINEMIIKLIEISESDNNNSYEVIKKKMKIKESFNHFVTNKNGVLSKYFNVSNVIGNAIPFIFNNIDDFKLYILYIYFFYFFSLFYYCPIVLKIIIMNIFLHLMKILFPFTLTFPLSLHHLLLTMVKIIRMDIKH